MKRIALTGATSMLGVSLIQECLGGQIEVIAISRPGSQNINRIPKSDLVKIMEWDICMNSPNSTADIDAFYHLAWNGTDQFSQNDVFLQNYNIEATLRAVELAHKMNAKKFIFIGSQMEFGAVNDIMSPETPVNPSTPYGAAKYAAEKMSLAYCKQLKMEHIAFRIFNVYGIYCRPLTMIHYCISGLLRNEPPNLTKCEQMWDYAFAEDAGLALRLTGEKGKNEAVYCFGSGIARPLREYVEIIQKHINNGTKINFGAIEYQEGCTLHLQADIRTLTEDTGFTPQVPFEIGILKTIDWIKSTCP